MWLLFSKIEKKKDQNTKEGERGGDARAEEKWRQYRRRRKSRGNKQEVYSFRFLGLGQFHRVQGLGCLRGIGGKHALHIWSLLEDHYDTKKGEIF